MTDPYLATSFCLSLVSYMSWYINEFAGSAPKRGMSVGAEISLSANEPGGTCSIVSLPCRHLSLFVWVLKRCSFLSSHIPGQSYSRNFLTPSRQLTMPRIDIDPTRAICPSFEDPEWEFLRESMVNAHQGDPPLTLDGAAQQLKDAWAHENLRKVDAWMSNCSKTRSNWTGWTR